MRKSWSDTAWDDYLYWQKSDRKTMQRINRLIKDIDRNGHNGIGNEEKLHGNLSGWYSKRISKEHRLVYRIIDNEIQIAQVRSHYQEL
ncbi:txe/YoeB family addiction module toxin [Lentilactobacillus fungorum]|uniref:Endoribonuclease YoeB n=1 Tax=Lentilactobacillus fungorum TaxID=2201250 RepID=A0ABQ3VX48_9LACO|nr:Txe/YoeB family addiction module toxin [Lentilactobacillus fungorum]GHP13258.1 txe/YoeB family addiction module toxin [Lentilactobacillus fungorum]